MALNRMSLALDIAANPKLPREEAERKAIAYSKETRNFVLKLSRRIPLLMPAARTSTTRRVLSRLWILACCRGWVNGCRHSRSQRGARAREHCQWLGDHVPLVCDGGVYKNKGFNVEHGPCPFCPSTTCGNKLCFVAWHLNDLKSPRRIVLESKGEEKGVGKLGHIAMLTTAGSPFRQ